MFKKTSFVIFLFLVSLNMRCSTKNKPLSMGGKATDTAPPPIIQENRSTPKDVTPPANLRGLFAYSGPIVQDLGGIDRHSVSVRMEFPPEIDDLNRLEVRRSVGIEELNCQSGMLIFQWGSEEISKFSQNPMKELVINSPTQVSIQSPVLYRFQICLWDSAGNLNQNHTAIFIETPEPPSVEVPDTIPPLNASLTEIVSSARGTITLEVSKLEIVDLDTLVLLRKDGPLAPNIRCDGQDGVPIFFLNSPAFTSSPITIRDLVPATGTAYSYRLCLRDKAGNLNNNAVLESLVAPTELPHDNEAPPHLASLTFKSGKFLGSIHGKIVLPQDISDYHFINVRRLEGSRPPECNEGSDEYSIHSWELSANLAREWENLTYRNGSPILGLRYSYSVCVYDRAGNFNKTSFTDAMSQGWIQIPKYDAFEQIPSCADFCNSKSYSIGVSEEGAQCASGENKFSSFLDFSILTFHYGEKDFPARFDSVSVGPRCYHTGQKRDFDRTDYSIGCFCKSESRQ